MKYGLPEVLDGALFRVKVRDRVELVEGKQLHPS